MSTTLQEVNLADPDVFVQGVPHDMFDVLRKEAPVYFHAGNDEIQPFWCVVKNEDVRVLSRDYPHFSSERGGITLFDPDEEQMAQQRMMMLQMDPPKHTKLRVLVNKGFTPRMVGQLHQHVRDIARTIVDGMIERGECDFVVDVASELPLQVIAEIMGVPQEDRYKLFDWSNRMIGSQDPEYAVSSENAMQAATEMFLYANELAAKKRANPDDDIISALLQAEVDGEKLNDIEFDLFFELLAVAGNETTRNLVSHGMHLLLEHPDQHQRLVDDPSLVDTAVEEMLRYASPVMYMRRTVQSEFELHGETLREGDKVALWYIAANRDEDLFDDPHRFDVGRTPNEHVAFGGGGPHFCLGANLARLETRIMFAELLTRLRDVELTGPVQRLRSNFINGIKHMPVRFASSQ